MNGAGPPDRAQPLGLSTLQGRTRAQTPCPIFSCKDPKEKQPARFPWPRGHHVVRPFLPITISSCENKASRATRGDEHGTGP